MKKFENYIKKKFSKTFPDFIYQKRIKKYTVDWMYSKNNLNIIIECDEKCHLDRSFLYEMYRMYNIMRILDETSDKTSDETSDETQRYVFIKFNPDSLCHIKGKFRFKKRNKCIDNQINIVSNLIRNNLKNSFEDLNQVKCKLKIAFLYNINYIYYWYTPISKSLEEFIKFCFDDIGIVLTTKETEKKLKKKKKIGINRIILNNGNISIIKY